MALFKSGNPALSENRFRDTILDNVVTNENTMTVKGTLNKFGLLFLITIASAYYSWKEAANYGSDTRTLLILGVFGCIGVGILFAFKKDWGVVLAPLYALLEGFFLGTVSAFFEYQFATETTPGYYSGGYSGIVFQAVGLTFAVVAVMYLLYKFNILRATNTFKKVIWIATGGIAIFYIFLLISNWGFNQPMPGIMYEHTGLAIGFSVFVVALAALNLILDFDMIEKGAEMGAPKYMEWYSAFGLLVTIVWLYIEILRLLAKLNRN